MSEKLILEISDLTFAAIQQQARKAGTSPDHVAAAVLERSFGNPGEAMNGPGQLIEAEKQAARRRFERHFGAVDLGYSTGTDNEGIDTDLGKEYADPHETT